jgi:hypothetical protein
VLEVEKPPAQPIFGFSRVLFRIASCKANKQSTQVLLFGLSHLFAMSAVLFFWKEVKDKLVQNGRRKQESKSQHEKPQD